MTSNRRLSPHFTLGEMCRSAAAERAGISNAPPVEAIHALELLCVEVLEPLRLLLGRPIVVSSGYRSTEVNALARGSLTSQHCRGEAADIECPGVPNLALALQIERSALSFDQLILEFHTLGVDASGWVHVSHKGHGDRRQVLTATTDGKRTVYQPGLPAMQLPPR